MIGVVGNKISLKRSLDLEYCVYFTQSIFDMDRENEDREYLWWLCKGKKLMLVIDENVKNIYGRTIKKFFKTTGCKYLTYGLVANESNKNFETIADICSVAKGFGMQRDSIFVGIGGGVVLDVTGFVALMYRRKVPYIRIPTTLVGIIDAGVGIKVGINFDGAKNFLGGYHPPLAVFNEATFLKTLSLKEMRCGLYEMIKMAIIKDSALFDSIVKRYSDFLKRELTDTTEMNLTAARLMMEELESNLLERELKRLADFGHTFSPYIETWSDYDVPHGEAVGIDTLMSAYISMNRGGMDGRDFAKILNLTKSIGFTKRYTLPDSRSLYASLVDVLRHRAGELNLVLPVKIGDAIFSDRCSFLEIDESLRFLRREGLCN